MANIDSLEIKLTSNAKSISKDFDTLSKSLDSLSKIDIKTVYKNLNSVSRVMKNFANEIKSLDTSKIEIIAKSINAIGYTAQKSMQKASKSVSELNKNMADTSGVKKSQQSYEEFMESIKGLGKDQKFFGTSSQLGTEITSTQNKIEKIRTSLDAYNREGKSVETKGWRSAQRQLEQYTNYLNTLMAKQKEAEKSVSSGIDTMVNKNAGNEDFQSRLAEVSEEVRQWYSQVEADMRGLGSGAIDSYYSKLRSIIMKPEIDNDTMLDEMDSLSLEMHKRFKAEPIKPQVQVDLDKFMQQTSDATKKASQSLKNRLSFEPTKLGEGQKYTDEYKALEKDILRAEKQLEGFLNTQERLDSMGTSKQSQRYKNVVANIEQTDTRLQTLYKTMMMLQSQGGDVINPNQFDILSQKTKNAQNSMSMLAKALRAGEFGGAATLVQRLGMNVGSLSGGFAKAGEAAEGTSKALAGMQTAIPVIGIILATVTILVKAFTSLGKAVINAFKKIGTAVKSVVTKVKELAKSILTIGSSSYQAQTMVGKFINKIINMFKSRILRQAITQAMQYMKQGFKDLEAYSNSVGTPFHNNMATLVADMVWLGRSLAAAFEPLINVAIPILDFLIDKVVQVINIINQFFSALTGSSTWTKATKGASSYESATSGAAKAQESLNKQIREWDNLNVITNPNKGSGSGGSGTGGSGNVGAFTTEEVPNSVKNLADKIKESWEKNADFTWLGTDIGNKVKNILDGIPWEEKIKPSASKFGTAFATTINGFVEVPGLADTIGHTIAEAINTVVETFDSFTSNIHGDSIGEFIGELVSKALDDIEWSKYIHGMGELGDELAKGINALADTDVLSSISSAFANILRGAIEGAYKFITKIDFKNLGTKIGDSINTFFEKMNEVDSDGMTGFEKLGKTISDVGTGLLDMISTAIDETDWSAIGESIVDFLKEIDWVDLFLKTKGLKDEISKALWELFIEAIKGMAELKIEIAIDILSKVQKAYELAKEWLKNKAIDIGIKVLSFVDKVQEKWNEAKEWLSQKALDIGIKVFNFVGEIQQKWNEAKEWLSTNLLNIGTKISDFGAEIQQKWSDAKTWLSTNLLEVILNAKDNVGTKIDEIKRKWEELKFKAKSLTVKVKGGATKAISNVKKAWKGVKSGTKNFTMNLKGGALRALEKIQKLWDGFKSKVKNLSLTFTDNFSGKLKSMWNGLATTVNNGLSKLHIDKKLPTFAGYATGGFPEDGWFRASRGEYFGKFDNGQSVIANNKQIENGLMNTVRVGNADLVSIMSQSLTETRKQNELLRQILAKETGINYKDVYKAYQKGAREETWRTGRAH